MMTIRYTLTPILDQNSLEKFRQFLKANKLPASDIKLEGSLFFGYHDKEGKLIGSGGLEFYNDCALLRSVAIDEPLRGHSFGKKIVEDLLAKAKNLKIKDVYLLTETAHNFFLKKGFADVPREKTPDIIKLSTEFSQVCPASAAVMKLTLSKKKECMGNW